MRIHSFYVIVLTEENCINSDFLNVIAEIKKLTMIMEKLDSIQTILTNNELLESYLIQIKVYHLIQILSNMIE